MTPEPRGPYIRIYRAAQILGVHPNTIRHWVDNGYMLADRTPAGHRKLPVSEVERLLDGWKDNALRASALAALGATRSGVGSATNVDDEDASVPGAQRGHSGGGTDPLCCPSDVR